MALRNGEHLRVGKLSQGAESRVAAVIGSHRRRSCALEAKRCDVERTGEKPNDVVRPDPHAAIWRVWNGLAKEQKVWA